ncbi:MAG: APC family permease [Rhodococcus sp. (in: high G+C Gram-positive bacteria)]
MESPAVAAVTLRRGALKAHDIVFFVVAAAAPLTVMVAVAPIALLIGGVGSPAGYLAAGLVNAVFAVGFTRMAKYIHNNGAFYSYIRRGLGRLAGLGSALVALVSYNLLQLSTYGVFGAITSGTIDQFFGVSVPWWACSLLALVVVAFLGYRSVSIGAKVLGVLLVLEVLVLVVLAVAVVAEGGATGLTLEPLAPQHVFTGSMGAVLAVAFAAFVGFEATALYRGEAQDPDRSVPRATYVAVGFLLVFYAFIVWIAVMAYGIENVIAAAATDPSGFFFTAMEQYVGTLGADVMRVLTVTSGLAALLAFHNAITRYGHALGREMVLPFRLCSVHPRHGSPFVASIVQSCFAAVVVTAFALSGADPILQMAAWTASAGTLAILALQALTSVSVARFFLSGEGAHKDPLAAASGALAAVLLFSAVWLVLRHIDLATLTSNVAVNVIVAAIPVVVFLAGVLYGRWIKSNKPGVYDNLGTTDVDGALEQVTPASESTLR